MVRDTDLGSVRGWTAAGLVLAVVLLILAVAIRYAGTGRQDGVGPGGTVPVTWTDEGLAVRGWADRSTLEPGDVLHLWLSFENQSDAPIRGLAILDVEAQGFERTKPECWANSIPVCRSGESGAARTSGLPGTLAAGQAVTLWAPLRAMLEGRREVHSITTLVKWGEPRQRRRSITAGPIVIEGAVPWWLPVSEGVYTFFKDLGLALALALLAYLFGRMQSERDREQQSRNLLLARAAENAITHLLPVLSGAVGLSGQIGELRRRPSRDRAALADAVDRTFYYLLFTCKRMLLMEERGGGIFFKRLDAESLVARAWAGLFEDVTALMSYRGLYEILDRMEKDESLTSLERRFRRPGGFFREPALEPTYHVGREALRRTLENDVALYRLQKFADVIVWVSQIEMNDLFMHVYQKQDTSSLDELERLIGELPDAPEDNPLAALRSGLRSYMNEKRGPIHGMVDRIRRKIGRERDRHEGTAAK